MPVLYVASQSRIQACGSEYPSLVRNWLTRGTVASPTPITGMFFDSISVTSKSGKRALKWAAVIQPEEPPPTIMMDVTLRIVPSESNPKNAAPALHLLSRPISNLWHRLAPAYQFEPEFAFSRWSAKE